MNLPPSIRLLLALVSGVALALAFPIFNFPLLAWISPAILILAVLGATPRFALLLGWLQGGVFYALSVPWFYNVMRQYGPLSVVAAGGVFLLVVFICAGFHALFGSAVAWLGRVGAAGRDAEKVAQPLLAVRFSQSPRIGNTRERENRTAKSGCATNVLTACVAAPFLWVTLEFAFLHFPAIGFPWNLLGYAAAGNLALVQVTAFTGIFGLSLLVAGYNALLAWAVMRALQGNRSSLQPLLYVTVLIAAIAFAGPRFVPQATADHTAHLVQTNFPVAMSYPRDWMESHTSDLDDLERISIGAAQKSPGIVVWPEVPAPFSLQDGRFLMRAQRIARGAGGNFLVGVVDWKPLVNGRIGANNSAALLDSSGALDFIYDKIHLVPFSEYVPWRKYLTFANGLTSVIGDFEHGTQYKVGNIPGGRFSTYICYEAIFPNEVRRFTLAGAGLFINISDDGWFGGSSAPPQHLAMARVRAVENRRWLLRDTNNGITVSVDPYGRIVARLPADVRGELDAPYGFRTDITPYARWGDWLPWLCVIVTLMLLLFGVRDSFSRRNS